MALNLNTIHVYSGATEIDSKIIESIMKQNNQ